MPRNVVKRRQLAYPLRCSAVSAPSFARAARFSIRAAASGEARKFTSASSEGLSRQSATGDMSAFSEVEFIERTVATPLLSATRELHALHRLAPRHTQRAGALYPLMKRGRFRSFPH